MVCQSGRIVNQMTEAAQRKKKKKKSVLNLKSF
jgi:hypothetical protein